MNANTRAMRITIGIALLVALSPTDVLARQPPDQDPAWGATAVEYRGRTGFQLEVMCPAGGRLGTVWGNNPYTDDSSICTAAVHAGLITPAAGGHVLIEIRGDRKAFFGNRRNGVKSNTYGPWQGSFVFPQAALDLPGLPEPPPDPKATTWSTTATELRGRLGERFEFDCPPGGTPGAVWGHGPYTDDSSICTAAVHAEVIDLAAGGPVWIEIQPGSDAYPACARNGIRTGRWGAYPGGFIVVHGAGPCPLPVELVDGKRVVDWATSARDLPGEPGERHTVVCPPGGLPGPVYGDGPYTDDSSVCTAAVHAGAIGLERGGAVTVQIRPGEPGYRARFSNGIQSRAWREWGRSFLILPAER